MSWSPDLFIGEFRPWPDAVCVVRGKYDETRRYVPEGERDMYRDLVGCMVHPDVSDQLQAENAKLRELLDAVLQCAGETKRDKGCDACPMYDGPWRNDGTWCLLRPTLRELGIEVNE